MPAKKAKRKPIKEVSDVSEIIEELIGVQQGDSNDKEDSNTSIAEQEGEENVQSLYRQEKKEDDKKEKVKVSANKPIKQKPAAKVHKIPALQNYLSFKDAAEVLGIKMNRFVELTRNGSLTTFWNTTGYVVRTDEVLRLKKSLKS